MADTEEVIREILFKLGSVESSLESMNKTMSCHFEQEMKLLERHDSRISSLEKTRNYLYGSVGTLAIAFTGFTASLWDYIFGG